MVCVLFSFAWFVPVDFIIYLYNIYINNKVKVVLNTKYFYLHISEMSIHLVYILVHQSLHSIDSRCVDKGE